MNKKLELWLCKKALLAHCEATGQILNLSSLSNRDVLRLGEELLEARMGFEIAQYVVNSGKLPQGMRADKNCKCCYGKGYRVRETVQGKNSEFCYCVKRDISPIIIMN